MERAKAAGARITSRAVLINVSRMRCMIISHDAPFEYSIKRRVILAGLNQRVISFQYSDLLDVWHGYARETSLSVVEIVSLFGDPILLLDGLQGG